MAHQPDPKTVHTIRGRLSRLVAWAFAIVVLIMMIIGLGVSLFNSGTDMVGYKVFFIRPALQSHYLENGGWQGLELDTFEPELLPFERAHRWWSGVYVLDQNGNLLLDEGQANTGLVGQPFQLDSDLRVYPIIVNKIEVGQIAIRADEFGVARYFLDVLAPLVMLSIFGGLLTIIFGMLLTRRVVYPLAEVIAASQAVTRGDLSARVEVGGSSDIRDLTDNFNRMADSLEQNETQRRNLMADVAHELRTPLTVMRGKLEGILDGVYPPDENHIAPVLEETYLLERLVEDLRLLTLAESRQIHFEMKEVDLDSLVGRIVPLFEAQASEKGITLLAQTTPGLPAVLADPQRLEQVIGNLVSNSLRHVPEGGKVIIETGKTASGLRVSVRDDGPGVPEADIPHLFERFWRGEKSRSRSLGGAGLGLAIAKQLVEAQGGQIGAKNCPEGGLEVVCEFDQSSG
jgi:two-component system OmpR family sensor kinase/two-component system sensor histidine kinase BaeS